MVSGSLAVPVGRPNIRGRLLAMGILALIGGFTFLPFLAAGNQQPVASVVPFALIATVVATLAAWPGLRCADATNLPDAVVTPSGRVERW